MRPPGGSATPKTLSKSPPRVRSRLHTSYTHYVDWMSDHYDLIVIGSGPAGEKGAAQAAYFGKRVCLVERAPKPGGAAVNTGTIPSKALRETALYFSGLRQRGLSRVDSTVKENITVAEF